MAVLPDAQREAGWTIAKLGDITTKIGSGSTPKGGKSSYVDEGPMVIRSQNVLDNELDLSDVAHVPEELTAKLKSVLVQKGDTLLNITGSGNTTIGRSALVNEDLGEAYVNQHVCIIRPNKSLVNEIFLQKSIFAFKDELLGLSYGSTRDALTKGIIESFEIPLPPLEEQERIAGILGSLDDKIEANTRLIQTMDSYKSALFQAHICSESEGETIKVSDVATLIRENIAASDIDESMNYVALEHIPRHSLYSHEWTNSEGVMSNKSGFKVGDILFGKLRPYFHKVSIAAVDGIASTDILVLRPKPGFEVLAQSVLSSEDLIEYATQVSSGTRMPRASWKDIMNYEVTVKNVEILQESLSGFDAYSRALIHENKVLTETRDALIKRLIG